MKGRKVLLTIRGTKLDSVKNRRKCMFYIKFVSLRKNGGQLSPFGVCAPDMNYEQTLSWSYLDSP